MPGSHTSARPLISSSGSLDSGAYLALGVRQSIFAEADRARLYDLYERYRAWLAETGLYDRNLVALVVWLGSAESRAVTGRMRLPGFCATTPSCPTRR